MKRHWRYLQYVLKHKWFVFFECLRFRVPLWRALAHDWDKFLPFMWQAYAETFYAPDGTSQYVPSPAFAYAWMRHQHRNKHHWQFWLHVNIPSHNCSIPLPGSDYMVWDSGAVERVMVMNGNIQTRPGTFPSDEVGFPDPMPETHLREMLADWFGAGRALGKLQAWDWYEKSKENMILHPDTRSQVETALEKRRQQYRDEIRSMLMVGDNDHKDKDSE